MHNMIKGEKYKIKWLEWVLLVENVTHFIQEEKGFLK